MRFIEWKGRKRPWRLKRVSVGINASSARGEGLFHCGAFVTCNITLHRGKIGRIDIDAWVTWSILDPKGQYWFYGPNAKHIIHDIKRSVKASFTVELLSLVMEYSKAFWGGYHEYYIWVMKSTKSLTESSIMYNMDWRTGMKEGLIQILMSLCWLACNASSKVLKVFFFCCCFCFLLACIQKGTN